MDSLNGKITISTRTVSEIRAFFNLYLHLACAAIGAVLAMWVAS